MVCLHRYGLEMEGLIPREIEEGSHNDDDHNKIDLCDERGELNTEQLERMFGPPTVLEDGIRRWGK